MSTCACEDMYAAYKADHLDCFVRLQDNKKPAFEHFLLFLVEKGKVEELKYLLDGRVEAYKFPNKAADEAVKHGQLEVLKLLWEKTCVDFDAAMTRAIRAEQLEVVRFLGQHRRGSYVPREDFIRLAAHGDHLESYRMLISVGFPSSPEFDANLKRLTAEASN